MDRAPPEACSSLQSPDIHMSVPTRRLRKIAIQKMPTTRSLSVGVTPSFFFFAMRYSIAMSAMPKARTIPIHLKIGFTVRLHGGEALSLPDFEGREGAALSAVFRGRATSGGPEEGRTKTGMQKRPGRRRPHECRTSPSERP